MDGGKWYAQRPGINYIKLFAIMVRLDTIRVILAMAAPLSWEIFQLDVNNDFIHGELKKEVFMQQYEGFIKKRE